MGQERLLFEYSSGFIIFCLAIGIGYAYILYRGKHIWSKTTNQILFVIRALLVSFLSFLLLGPILKLTKNIFEEPVLVLLIDDSSSLREGTDSTRVFQLNEEMRKMVPKLEDLGYQVVSKHLSDSDPLRSNFNHAESDLAGALQKILEEQEGKNLNGIVLVSDGIYNTGTSPVYSSIGAPVFTVGFGDTIPRIDLILKNLLYNKIAYQGNQFPLRAEIYLQGIQNQDVNVSIYHHGEKILSQQVNSGGNQLLNFDFKIDAVDKGLQRVDVVVERLRDESNFSNNRASAFIEVVEGKKKFLVVAPAPHPDLKVLRTVIEKNSNYEFLLHIPGVEEAEPDVLQSGNVDLIVFHNVIDQEGRTLPLFQRWSKSVKPILMILGRRTNTRQLSANNIPVQFELSGQWDEITPMVNSAFRDFSFSENANGTFSKYPPIFVPYGKFTYPAQAKILLYQKIGSVETERPLLIVFDENGGKRALMFGEGIWQWRLAEYASKENAEIFDETFSKIIQYMSTQEDKRKFRSFPIQTEFTEAEPVIFESQVYNDLFEPIFGHAIEIELKDEKNKATHYTYTTNPGNSRYRISGLAEGVYKYAATTEVSGTRELVRGEFLVKEQNIESQNLTADFNLLRKLSKQTGGQFFRADQLNMLEETLTDRELQSLIQTEDSFNPMINLKWVFFLLLALVSVEWFVRKYSGGY